MVSAEATIVANSTSYGDCEGDGTFTDDGYNLADDTSCGFSGTSLSDTPAGLDPSGLQNNGGPTETIALEPGSAAIGHVTLASDCTGNDQRGVPRPVPCDIGAYETNQNTIKVYLPGNLGIIHGFPIPVTFSVLGANKQPIPAALASAANLQVSFNGGPSVRATYVAFQKVFGALIPTSRTLAPGTYPLTITSNSPSVPVSPTTVTVKIIR
jgi:hypothetical protein